MSVAVIIGLVVAAAVVFIVLRARAAEEVTVRIDQIPDVVSQLKATGQDSSFAVFLFMPEGKRAHDDEEKVNLQYSIEGGHVGLDWVLLAPQNVTDQNEIAAYIKDHGFAANMREENNVRYLRVEDGDIAGLGVKIATEFYHLNPAAEVDLIVESFDWKSGADSS